jgi:AraC-like DNA-binding protein
LRQTDEANVASRSSRVQVIKVCTDKWPARDREAMFRDNVGRDAVMVEPLDGEPLRIDGTFVKLPELSLISSRRSALRSDFADGADRLTINLGGDALATQAGGEFVLKRGDAVAFTGSDLAGLTTRGSGHVATIQFENGSLHGLLKDPKLRHIPAAAPALLMLRRYLRAISTADLLETRALAALTVEHIHDLAALALGAGREVAEVAERRGVRAARLQAIKDDVLVRLQTAITLDEVAERHGVSPRYVRMLFGDQGTSFSEFVRNERLKRARLMLLSTGIHHLLISQIAYEVGFNDLSYFNRAFRSRFGMAPGELRERSRPDVGPASTKP